GELLTGESGELTALAASVRELDLDCVYSSPHMLWDDYGRLARQSLDEALSVAEALNARLLKMSIGGFHHDVSFHTLHQLADRLAGRQITLLIENDQT